MKGTRTTVTIVIDEPGRPAAHDPTNIDDLVWLAEHGDVAVATEDLELPDH